MKSKTSHDNVPVSQVLELDPRFTTLEKRLEVLHHQLCLYNTICSSSLIISSSPQSKFPSHSIIDTKTITTPSTTSIHSSSVSINQAVPFISEYETELDKYKLRNTMLEMTVSLLRQKIESYELQSVKSHPTQMLNTVSNNVCSKSQPFQSNEATLSHCSTVHDESLQNTLKLKEINSVQGQQYPPVQEDMNLSMVQTNVADPSCQSISSAMVGIEPTTDLTRNENCIKSAQSSSSSSSEETETVSVQPPVYMTMPMPYGVSTPAPAYDTANIATVLLNQPAIQVAVLLCKTRASCIVSQCTTRVERIVHSVATACQQLLRKMATGASEWSEAIHRLSNQIYDRNNGSRRQDSSSYILN